MSLNIAIAIDLVVALAAALGLRFSPLSRAAHPLTLYLFFHITIISQRGWALASGAPPTLGVTSLEYARALNYADLFLVMFALGSLSVTSSARAKIAGTKLLNGHLFLLAAICLPLGLYQLFTLSGAAQDAAVTAGSYARFAATWPGLILLAFIYVRGFRWYLVLPMLSYLMIMAMQGYGRFRVALPVLMLGLIAIDRRGRRWPTIKIAALAVAFFLLFIPLKSIATMIQDEGFNYSRVVETLEGSTSDLIRGENTQLSIGDQFAASLSLSDEIEPDFGRHYIAIPTIFIPRAIWPEKPALNEHIENISTSSRPLSTIGAVLTVAGEAYLDLRLPGLVLIGLALGRFLTLIMRRAYDYEYGTAQRFLFVVWSVILIQVYRDGLISGPIFLAVHFTPALILVVLIKSGVTNRPGRRVDRLSHRANLREVSAERPKKRKRKILA